ncbi:Epothilone C/D epoxidase [BD1-7 clade bacterium]|uniref:Epothilone C/D epoxidase n=1 Tax=BD1-7 clade bacterium TaxID=2029982 RepID=A0A5S9R219_9GAMM|nr:Epothilone C/D epoxidase [BD1-7 clade bacterium]
MQLSFATKCRIAAYSIKNSFTKPTFRGFNPNDTKGLYVNPNPVLDEMRRNHQIFFCPQIAAWVCSQDKKETFDMARSDKFSLNFSDWRFAPEPIPDDEQNALEKLLANLLIVLPSADHMRIRRLVQPAFLPRNVVKMEDAISRIVDEALENATGDFNLVEVSKEVPLKIIAELVGVPTNFQREFKGLAEAILATYMPTEAPDPALAFEGIRIVKSVIQDRRDNPRDDFISTLIQTADEDGDRLSIDEVMAFVASLLTAGPDTTTHFINSVIYTIVQHPEVIAELKADPSLIDNTVTESNRVNYFAHSGGIRFAKEDLELCGEKIAKGDMIKFNVNTANLDPSVFPDPFTFDIHRKNLKDTWVFGAGSHFCVGASLAKTIGRIFLQKFLEKVPNPELLGEPKYEKDFINRKMTCMMIRSHE